jgi:hypothetical protein
VRSCAKLQSARLSRLGAGVAAVALIGAASLLPYSTAHASDPPTIGGFYCASWGSGQFICTMTITGGIQPVMSSWTGTNVTFSEPSTDYAEGYCVVGQNAEVSVIVRDDMNQSAQASFTFTCE